MIDKPIEDTQRGFIGERSMQNLIFFLRQTSEKPIIMNNDVDVYFIYLKKAFDRIRNKDIWKTLEKIVDTETIEVHRL